MSVPTYLGQLLVARFKSIYLFDSLVEGFVRKLSGWKKGYISKGGKITLIHRNLASSLTYFMSLFCVPTSVAKGLSLVCCRRGKKNPSC